MTEQEAIEIIWERHMDCEDYFSQYDSYPDGYDFELDQAILIAAQALEEIQQYREIGTVEECREAAEKQKPKNPETYTETVQTVTGCFEVDVFECPVCGSYVCNVGDKLPNYCDNCGQAIDENLEGMEDE